MRGISTGRPTRRATPSPTSTRPRICGCSRPVPTGGGAVHNGVVQAPKMGNRLVFDIGDPERMKLPPVDVFRAPFIEPLGHLVMQAAYAEDALIELLPSAPLSADH